MDTLIELAEDVADENEREGMLGVEALAANRAVAVFA
jgi:hypothetical protein